jgi:FixJ family two-component response regulator
MPAQRVACSVQVTPREVEILNLLAQGFDNADIGVTIGIGTGTVTSMDSQLSCMSTIPTKLIAASFWPATGVVNCSASAPAGMIIPLRLGRVA